MSDLNRDSAFQLTTHIHKHMDLVACTCFVFHLRLPYFLGILFCTSCNTSGYTELGRAPNNCCRRCHLVCLFPDSFLRNVERRGGDVPTQAARRAQGVKVCFPRMSKTGFGTLDLILRFLSTTLVRELRFSGQRTPPLFWRSAMLLSVISTRSKHLVACVCLVFSFWSS